MPSDDPKIDDDFEDIDFDDVDEDIDDESWDDFDEDTDDSEVSADDATVDDFEDDAFADEDDSDAKPVKQKKKGGGSLNMIIIGAAAVIGGGILYFTMFSGGSAPVPALQPTADAESDTLADTTPADAPPVTTDTDNAFLDIEELNTDLPPMPAPLESAADELASSIDDIESLDTEDLDLADLDFDSGTDQSADATVDDVLTPIPDLSDTADTELADLDFEDTPQEDPATLMDDTTVSEIENAVEDVTDMDIDLGEPEEPATIIEAPAETAALTEDSSQEDLRALVNDLNMQVSAREKSLSKTTAENSALSAQLDQAESKISELESQLAQMQKELKSAKSSSSAVVEPIKSPTKTTTSAPPAASSTPAGAKPAPKIVAVKWTLRSASPGNATIASDKGDFRRVEVGDRVPGLGRIRSIAIEGGKWVVKGSSGSVSQ